MTIVAPLVWTSYIEAAELQSGADLTSIGDLADTEEYQSCFRGMTVEQIITEIYNQLFGRDPKPEGLGLYV